MGLMSETPEYALANLDNLRKGQESETVVDKEWVKYPSLERIERLHYKGSELLGKIIYWTEKRDGSNVSVWLSQEKEQVLTGYQSHKVYPQDGKTYNVIVSSRNQEQAEGSLVLHLRGTKEYEKILEFLTAFPNYVVFGELIPNGKGPTKIEPKHKKYSYVIFDLFDKEFAPDGGRFLAYPAIYQHCYHFKLPITKLLATTRHLRLGAIDGESSAKMDQFKSLLDRKFFTLEEIDKQIRDEFGTDLAIDTVRDILLKWCKKHRREGVVGKCFNGLEAIYFKEKVDLPSEKIIKAIMDGQTLQIPPLPESEIMGAIDKSWQELGDEQFKDKSKAMPLISRLVQEECKKHLCNLPKGKNLYSYYLEYLKGRGW